MNLSETFRAVNAVRVVASDGTEVYLVNSNELEYRRGGRSAIFPAERCVADDGAPDGRVVSCGPPPAWSDGSRMSQADLAVAVADIRRAAAPLRTKFEFD
jgi:hypothetical protein